MVSYRHRKFFYSLILLFCLSILSYGAHAQNIKSKKDPALIVKKNSLSSHDDNDLAQETSVNLRKRTEESEIPAGFENITNDYQGKVQLVVGLEPAGEANVDYAERQDRITLSAKAISLIEKAVQRQLTTEGKKQLQLALQKPMTANAEETLPYMVRSPHKITAHFNLNDLTLTIFIPSKYHTSKQLNYGFGRTHPDPSNDYPINSLYYNVYNDFTKKNQQKKVMWQVNGVLSSGRNSVHYQANSLLKDYINELYGEHYGVKYQYSLGYQQPSFRTKLAPSGNYWGFSMQESPHLINPAFYRHYKIPLTLVLDQPYFVQILQRGNILFSGNLPQGESAIKTSRFPIGTYPITIKKRDLISGVETKNTQIYSSQASAYNWLYSGFAMAAGVRSQAFKLNDGYSNAEGRYFFIKNGFNVLKGDWDFSYTYVNKHHYFGTQYDYLSENNFDYTLSSALDEKGSLLGGVNATYRFGQSNLGANLSHSYITDDNGFSSLSNNYSLNYSYSGETWTANATALYSNTNSQIGGGINKTFHWGVVPLSINVSASHSETKSFQVLVSLSVALNKNGWHNSMQTKYDVDDAKTGFNLSNAWKSSESQSQVSNNFSIPTGSRNLQDSLNAKYATRYANLYTNISAAKKQNTKLTQTQAQFGVQGAYLQSFHGFKLLNKPAKSGVILHLPSVDDSNEKYQVNNKTYKQGEMVFIPQRAFSKAEIIIGSPSMHYRVKPDYHNAFLYPYNIHHIDVKADRLCSVSFTLDPSKEGFWILQDTPDVFVMPGEETYALILQGNRLVFDQLADEPGQPTPQKCNTNIIVQCNGKDELSLGTLSCR